jgi:choline dehydrogenase
MPDLKAEYDYIVVGAGAAGSIVAAKLARAGRSVLLLELGGRAAADDPRVWDPTGWPALLTDPAYEIGFTSAPRPLLYDRTFNMLQCRGLGGSQLHNAMVYVRGGALTYDYWASEFGLTDWCYASLQPCFEEIESRVGVITGAVDAPTHALTETALRLGYAASGNPDYNQADAYGPVVFQFTMQRGPEGLLRRTTAFEKFVDEAALANLTVVTSAAMLQLLLDVPGAPGVLLRAPAGGVSEVRARCEVILSAGAIATPTILLRSGVGDGEALKRLGVAVVQHAPEVGRNFYDDLGCGIPLLPATPLRAPYGYLPFGLFASDQGPGVQPKVFGDINLEMQVCPSLFTPTELQVPAHDVVIGVSALHLAGGGTVTLDPTDPNGLPIVAPGWLQTDGDLQRCLKALELVKAFAQDPTLQKQMGWTPWPKALETPPEEWIRAAGATVQHYVGTCRMGTDAASVVDPQLRLRGVEGVRVIDASIAPTSVTGNTAGVSMVIGLKGANLLLGGA